MATYEPSKIKFGIGFVVLLAVMVFVFFIVAGRMQRHSYYQPANQNPAGPSQAPTHVGP